MILLLVNDEEVGDTGETVQELVSNVVLAVGYLLLLIYTCKLWYEARSVGQPPMIKRMFWAMVLLNSVCRCLWFGIPDFVFGSPYRPSNQDEPGVTKMWLGFIQYFLQTTASSAFYTSYLLIIYFWASTFSSLWRSNESSRPSIAEVPHPAETGQKFIESPRAKHFFIFACTLIYSTQLAIDVAYFFVDYYAVLLMYAVVAMVFSLAASAGFIIYGAALWHSIRPLIGSLTDPSTTIISAVPSGPVSQSFTPMHEPLLYQGPEISPRYDHERDDENITRGTSSYDTYRSRRSVLGPSSADNNHVGGVADQLVRSVPPYSQRTVSMLSGSPDSAHQQHLSVPHGAADTVTSQRSSIVLDPSDTMRSDKSETSRRSKSPLPVSPPNRSLASQVPHSRNITIQRARLSTAHEVQGGSSEVNFAESPPSEKDIGSVDTRDPHYIHSHHSLAKANTTSPEQEQAVLLPESGSSSGGVPVLSRVSVASRSGQSSHSTVDHRKAPSVSHSHISGTAQDIEEESLIIHREGYQAERAYHLQMSRLAREKMRNIQYVTLVCVFAFLLKAILSIYEVQVTARGLGQDSDSFPKAWWLVLSLYYLIGEVGVSFAVLVILRTPAPARNALATPQDRGRLVHFTESDSSALGYGAR